MQVGDPFVQLKVQIVALPGRQGDRKRAGRSTLRSSDLIAKNAQSWTIICTDKARRHGNVVNQAS